MSFTPWQGRFLMRSARNRHSMQDERARPG